MKRKRKPQIGGARPGAGRPRTGRTGEILHMRISPEQKRWLTETAARNDQTITEYVLAALRSDGMPT